MQQPASHHLAKSPISTLPPPSGRISISTVAAHARGRAQAIAENLLGEPISVTSSEVRWRPNYSLSLCVDGPNSGRWRDFITGEHGDVVDLVARERSISTLAAADLLSSSLNLTNPAPIRSYCDTSDKAALEERILDARKAWEASIPLAGSLAQRYLVSRLCGLPLPARVLNDDSIRYCSMNDMPARRRFRGPAGAMVALLCDPISNAFLGVQRTFLTETGQRYIGQDGKRMNPMLLGSTGVVKLCDDAEVTHGLGLGEGIETTIAGQMLFDGPPSWAALSASNLSKFPVLRAIQSITIYADSDVPDRAGQGAGRKAAAALMNTWDTARPNVEFTVHVPKAIGADFNDVLVSVMTGPKEVSR